MFKRLFARLFPMHGITVHRRVIKPCGYRVTSMLVIDIYDGATGEFDHSKVVDLPPLHGVQPGEELGWTFKYAIVNDGFTKEHA